MFYFYLLDQTNSLNLFIAFETVIWTFGDMIWTIFVYETHLSRKLLRDWSLGLLTSLSKGPPILPECFQIFSDRQSSNTKLCTKWSFRVCAKNLHTKHGVINRGNCDPTKWSSQNVDMSTIRFVLIWHFPLKKDSFFCPSYVVFFFFENYFSSKI